ncbi:hypothetical protein ACF3NG_07995 [Aerococcaceae bacterium WGS1372]
MSIIYTYLAFTIHQINSYTLYLSMDNEDASVYQMYFQHELECTNFQKVLYQLSDKMEANGVDANEQTGIISRLTESNLLYYEYDFVCSRMSS